MFDERTRWDWDYYLEEIGEVTLSGQYTAPVIDVSFWLREVLVHKRSRVHEEQLNNLCQNPKHNEQENILNYLKPIYFDHEDLLFDFVLKA